MLLDQCSIKTLVSTHSQKLPKQTTVTAAQGNKYVKQGSMVTSPGLGDTNENFWTFSSIFWLVSLWQFRTQPICHSSRQNMPVVSKQQLESTGCRTSSSAGWLLLEAASASPALSMAPAGAGPATREGSEHLPWAVTFAALLVSQECSLSLTLTVPSGPVTRSPLQEDCKCF